MFKSASFNRPGQDRTDLDLVAFARLHCADNCPKAYRTYPTGRILCSHSNRSFSRVSSLLLPFFFSRSLPNERTNERTNSSAWKERKINNSNIFEQSPIDSVVFCILLSFSLPLLPSYYLFLWFLLVSIF